MTSSRDATTAAVRHGHNNCTNEPLPDTVLMRGGAAGSVAPEFDQ
jgi:hypothetical protein